MRKILLFTAAFVFVAPAFAQDSVIRIINEDGSVQEVEIPAPRAAPPPTPRQPVPVPVQTAPQPLPPQEPPPPPEIEIPAVDPQMPQNLKAIVEPVSAPVQEDVYEDEAVEWNQDERQLPEGYVVLPPRKPANIPYRHAKPDYATLSTVPSGPVSKEQAVAIALEKAPPASSVVALPREYQGVPIYLVKFRTADGPLDIMVDMATGDIVSP